MRIRKPNRTRIVVAALGARIATGEFAPGALLPSEMVLEQEYEVSRTVIREATKILSAKGLVTVRQRHGTHVNPREQWMWMDGELISWLANGKAAKSDLLAFAEARQIIEPGAAALAALRATQKQRVEIVAAYERMKTGHASPQEAILADKQFHLAILDATHNPVLQSLRQTIESILDAIFPHTVGTFTHNLDNHGEVADAIARGDPEAARANMEKVLQHTTGFLQSAG